MEKIASFTVDHLRLLTGLYVSRVDDVNGTPVTTFDIRMTRPNEEPPMDNPGIHCFEHLGATFLRNDPEWKQKVIYFGPMGCRTGFYLLLAGSHTPEGILDLIRRMFDFIAGFEGDIPGASPKDCGNYLDMNPGQAKFYARKYIAEVLEKPEPARFTYPD
ncbi:MAG: S-ribosylhomocysteine lyase [Clostridiales bacterium]|nr:S-ribosylhomocysteine lyase [Clostridiales bacterium]